MSGTRKTRFFANLAESCLKCDLCDARFWIQSKLEKHRTTHVEGEPICVKTFPECGNLEQQIPINNPHSDRRSSQPSEDAMIVGPVNSRSEVQVEKDQRNSGKRTLRSQDELIVESLSPKRARDSQRSVSTAKIALKGGQSDAQVTPKDCVRSSTIVAETPAVERKKSILKSSASAKKREVTLAWKKPLISDVRSLSKALPPLKGVLPSLNVSKGATLQKEESDVRKQQLPIPTSPIVYIPASETSKSGLPITLTPKKPTTNKIQTPPVKTVLQVDDVSFRNLIFDKLQLQTTITKTVPNVSTNSSVQISPAVSSRIEAEKIDVDSTRKLRFSDKLQLQTTITKTAAKAPVKRLAPVSPDLSSCQKIDVDSTRKLIISDKLQLPTTVTKTVPNVSTNCPVCISSVVPSDLTDNGKKNSKPDITLIMLPAEAKKIDAAMQHSSKNDLDGPPQKRCKTSNKKVITFDNSFAELSRRTDMSGVFESPALRKGSPVKTALSSTKTPPRLNFRDVSIVLRRLPPKVVSECLRNGCVPMKKLRVFEQNSVSFRDKPQTKCFDTMPKNVPSKSIVSSSPKHVVTVPSQNAVPICYKKVITVLPQSVVSLPSKRVITVPSQSVVSLPSKRVITVPSQNVVSLPSKRVITVPSQNVVPVPHKKVITVLPQSVVSLPPKNIVPSSPKTVVPLPEKTTAVPVPPKQVKVVTVSGDFMKKLKETMLVKSQSSDTNPIHLVVSPEALQQMRSHGKTSVQNQDARSTRVKRAVEIPPDAVPQLRISSRAFKADEPSRVVVYGVEDMRRDDQQRREHREKIQERERMLRKMLVKYEEKERMKEAKLRMKKIARILERKMPQLKMIQEKVERGSKWEDFELLKELWALSSGESALEIAEMFRCAGFETLEEKMGIADSYSTTPAPEPLQSGPYVRRQYFQPGAPDEFLPGKIRDRFPSVYNRPPTVNDSLNSSTIKYSSVVKKSRVTRRGAGLRGARKPAKVTRKPFEQDPFTDLSMITEEKYILECPCKMPFCNALHS